MTVRLLILAVLCQLCFGEATAQNDTLQQKASTNAVKATDAYRHKPVRGSTYIDLIEAEAANMSSKTIFQSRGARFILPAVFIAYGASARFNQLPIRQFDFDIDHEVKKKWPPGESSTPKIFNADRYLEFVTPALAYGLGFIPGIPAEHNLRDRTLIMATSYLVMEGMVLGLKQYVPVMRPNDEQRPNNERRNNSFPSGHTASAITGAHIMYREYKDVSPWIGVGGYLMATATGTFRILNRAHWLSDVVTGAGIGLLSAEIGYMMLPVWHSLFGIDDSDASFVALPAVSPQSVGFGIVYQF